MRIEERKVYMYDVYVLWKLTLIPRQVEYILEFSFVMWCFLNLTLSEQILLHRALSNYAESILKQTRVEKLKIQDIVHAKTDSSIVMTL